MKDFQIEEKSRKRRGLVRGTGQYPIHFEGTLPEDPPFAVLSGPLEGKPDRGVKSRAGGDTATAFENQGAMNWGRG